MRILLAAVLLVACGPPRPRAGARTIIINVPISESTGDLYRDPEYCQPCLREQREGEKLVNCAMNSENVRAHWDTMMCSFEAR